jgi:hypothetical protein
MNFGKPEYLGKSGFSRLGKRTKKKLTLSPDAARILTSRSIKVLNSVVKKKVTLSDDAARQIAMVLKGMLKNRPK